MTFARLMQIEGALYVTALLYLAVVLAWGLTRLAIKAHRYERIKRAVGGDGPALALVEMLEHEAEHRDYLQGERR